MVSSTFPYKKNRQRVLDREMAYVEVGEGNPIVFLHGNPTSSYLWRNVLPHLQPLGRCIAPDLPLRHKNMLHNVFDPEDFRPVIVNWADIAGWFIRQLHEEIAATPSDQAIS